MTQNNNRSYEYLIQHFGEDCLRKRFIFIYGSAEKYIINANLQNFAIVSEYLVDELLLDYFSDIARMKEFHGLEKANAKKVAGYTAFWVSRRKPIQLIKEISQDDIVNYPQLKWINENFAVSLLLSMAFDASKPIVGVDWGNFNRFEDNLRYYFTFRHLNSQMLELILNALDVQPIYERLSE